MVKSRLFLSLLGTLLAPVLSTAISSDVRATPVDGMLAVGRAPVLMEERLHNLRRRESPVIEDETAATIDFAEVIRLGRRTLSRTRLPERRLKGRDGSRHDGGPHHGGIS